MNHATRPSKVAYSVRVLAALGMLTALSVVLTWLIHFPIFPGAPFLEYDPADIPILIGTFTFGPLAGLLLTIAVSAVQAFTVSAQSGVMGFLMHSVATGAMAVAAGIIYCGRKTRKSALIALIVGTVTMTVVMIPLNLIITPLFTGTAIKDVWGIMFSIIIPFNLIKSGLNSVVTFILYEKCSGWLRGKY
ncbi:MAG: ECF transporter S component [Clostridiales bacterium]|jgi:riboflavin transporter FmnP|nr:ECF transporter S component [Clostridiales bacterium]